MIQIDANDSKKTTIGHMVAIDKKRRDSRREEIIEEGNKRFKKSALLQKANKYLNYK